MAVPGAVSAKRLKQTTPLAWVLLFSSSFSVQIDLFARVRPQPKQKTTPPEPEPVPVPVPVPEPVSEPGPEPEPEPGPEPELQPRDDTPISQDSIAIRTSSIPDAGQGAFAAVGLAPATLLGTYAGERLSSAEAQARYPRGDAYYLLAVPGADDLLVDAADPERSNWLRYLNHA